MYDDQRTQPAFTSLSETQPGSAVSPATAIPRKKRGPRRKFPSIRVWETVRDVHGVLWDVREVRRTHHDFDLLFGRLASMREAKYGTRGPKQLIATPALVAFWKARNASAQDNFDFPVSRKVITRLRTRLGFGMRLENRKFWSQRLTELKELSIAELATRYHVHPRTVSHWRGVLLENPVTHHPAAASCGSMEPNP